ncbi:MAG TPA: cation-translocating P-type ATPase [Kofleriaceae bacterium]|nr:cation-translocating P-type ATPase [Kofleriaceae bacterium]
MPAATGLTQDEARQRLRDEGPNEIAASTRHGIFRTLLGVLREPMLLLLLAAGGLYLVLGDPREAATLLAFVVLVVVITLVQERRTENAVEALRDLSSPRALVVRDGGRKRIAGREVVRGDLVVISEGDRVPADGVLVEATNLQVDESLLTGESVPVRKRVGGASVDTQPGGDDLPTVFSGTLVVSGHGQYEVTSTGGRTAMGRIGKVLSEVELERTPLQQEVSKVVRRVAIGALALCLTIVVIYGLSRQDWLGGVLAGITVAMSLLPEEFPVVFTVFQALGAWRIAKSNVLTRRMPALEALGAATVLCSDKTGTLTLNRMRVARLEVGDVSVDVAGKMPALPEDVHALVEYAILASQHDPFDPMEVAFHDLGRAALSGSEHLHDTWRPLREYPLAPELLAMSHVYAPDGKRFLVAAKGAPEAISDLCHLSPEALDKVRSRVRVLAAEGMRVLAVARAELVAEALPDHQHDFEFQLVGLVGLVDPVRDVVPAAVAECHAAGIRVVMITGDYPETARAIGQKIGLQSAEVVTGAEVAAMTDEGLRERAKAVSIFARMVPEQKLRLVRALAAEGEVVAMTGDGVNDAPALKAASIGIAMGGRGTDVAREAAALVLTDDDFTSIVAAMRLGRRIFDNLKKAMGYVIAVHVPIAGLSLIPVLIGWPMLLQPIHVAFLELVIDPACSIAFEAEPEEPDVMQRPPRPTHGRLFTPRMLMLSLLQGLSVLGASLLLYVLAGGHGDSHARTLAFTSLMAGNLSLIIVNRSWRSTMFARRGIPNLTSLTVVVVTLALLVAIVMLAPLRTFFAFGPLTIGELAIALASGPVALAWFEILKAVAPRILQDREPRSALAVQ